VLASGFTADWYVSSSDLAVIAYSTSSTFSGSGTLFSLSVKVDIGSSEGEKDIAFVTFISDSTGSPIIL
jgi:hypothetical protein